MKNNLAFQILQKLDNKCLKQLKHFINSPFFNTSEKLTLLLTYLIACIKKDELPSKAQLFQTLYGKDLPYEDQKVRLALSDLLKVIEDFLVYQQTNDNETARLVALSQYYQEIDLEKHFDRTRRKALLQLEKTPFRNHQYFSLSHQIRWAQYELESSKKRDTGTNLQVLGQDFDIAYFSKRLRQACSLKAQQTFLTKQYDFHWVKQLLEHIRFKNWLEIPAISIYYYAFELYNSTDKTGNFEALKKQILNYGTLFPIDEIRDIYILAINYCIRMVNGGQKAYIKESLDLYKAGLTLGCFLNKGILSKFTYANIVAAGLMAQDYAWVESFIHQYKNNLQKADRASSFRFNMARLEYTSNKNYDKALSYLQKVSDKDLMNILNTKILQLRIYYETSAFDLLESHLEAMTNFIKRKQLLGYHKENYLNIVKYTRKLLKVNPFDKSAIKKLEKAIREQKILSEKDWLLKQLNS